MKKQNSILAIVLAFIGFSSYSQQGLECYNFDGTINFIFDGKISDYKETTKTAIKGQIIISYLDNTVEINSSENKRKFKLIKVDVEPGTFRTMLNLNENGVKYSLAIATKYFTLIGENDRIIYNRVR